MENDNSKYDPKKNFNRWLAQQEQLVETMYQVEAIIRILERKGITDTDELTEEVRKLKTELEWKIRRNSWEN